jgi:hypothetical protein
MAFKMRGNPMRRNFGIGSPTKKGHTEPEKGNYREPKGKVKPGELRSQALAREAKGNILVDEMPKIKPGKLTSPRRHAESKEVKAGMAATGIKDPKAFSTDGQISRSYKHAGPKATRTQKPDPRFDYGMSDRTIKGSTVSLPAPKTKKQKRQDKRTARKNK